MPHTKCRTNLFLEKRLRPNSGFLEKRLLTFLPLVVRCCDEIRNAPFLPLKKRGVSGLCHATSWGGGEENWTFNPDLRRQ